MSIEKIDSLNYIMVNIFTWDPKGWVDRIVNFMNKKKKPFKTETLRDDIRQFIAGFVNGNPNNEGMTIIVEPKQTSLHLFEDWLKGAMCHSQSRSNKIRSPGWGKID